MSGFRFTMTPLQQGVSRYGTTLVERCMAAVQPLAPRITAWMQANHGWTNRTGAAERGLHTEIEQRLTEIAIAFAHDPNLDYPIYLETKFGGRDGVIRPAMDVWGPEIMQALRGVVA